MARFIRQARRTSHRLNFSPPRYAIVTYLFLLGVAALELLRVSAPPSSPPLPRLRCLSSLFRFCRRLPVPAFRSLRPPPFFPILLLPSPRWRASRPLNPVLLAWRRFSALLSFPSALPLSAFTPAFLRFIHVRFLSRLPLWSVMAAAAPSFYLLPSR